MNTHLCVQQLSGNHYTKSNTVSRSLSPYAKDKKLRLESEFQFQMCGLPLYVDVCVLLCCTRVYGGNDRNDDRKKIETMRMYPANR